MTLPRASAHTAHSSYSFFKLFRAQGAVKNRLKEHLYNSPASCHYDDVMSDLQRHHPRSLFRVLLLKFNEEMTNQLLSFLVTSSIMEHFCTVTDISKEF